ncbi:hypothetical protein AOCH_002404, partial [Aspergillus ochraceoroseus]
NQTTDPPPRPPGLSSTQLIQPSALPEHTSYSTVNISQKTSATSPIHPSNSIMAPSIMSPVSTPMDLHFQSKRVYSSRQVSGVHDADSVSTIGMGSSRVVSRKFQTVGTTNITSVVSSLQRRSGEELGTGTSSRLLAATHATILDWIRTQRMSFLPPEGSDYDKVLAWAQLFVERLHTFDLAIEQFAGDSYLAAQLAYGYCAMLLELGKENASALMVSFGFFYTISMSLGNLLERTELFGITREVQEQLTLALSDLVTLVASVSTYFHKAIRGMTTASVSINLYRTFPGQINTFQQRCEKIAESMWRHQLLRENIDGDRVSEIRVIRSWLSPEDAVLSRVADTSSHLAHDREELTCLWMAPYLTRFLKSDKKHLCIAGPPGSGKTVLASVMVDQLQHPQAGVSYHTLFISVSSRTPAQASLDAIAKSLLLQLFEKRIGNVQLFRILSDALNRSKETADHESYDKLLWGAVEQALSTALRGAKDLVVVVDGIDEASCPETTLLEKLTAVASKSTSTKLITLGSQSPKPAPGQSLVRVTDDLVFDDIAAVVRSCFRSSPVFNTLPSMDQETVVERIANASNCSFLWAKLIAKRARQEQNADGLRKTVDSLITSKVSMADFVSQSVQHTEVSLDAKMMLLWLATANRPLHVKELSALASIRTDKQTISDAHVDPLHTLKPLNSLVFLENDLFYLRHGLIRTAVIDVFSQGKLIPNLKDRHADLITRLLIYIKLTVTEQHEPSSVSTLDQHDTNTLLDKFPLLDFALRYWVPHLLQTTAFTKDEAGASKELAKVLPASTTFVLLLRSVWESIATPKLLAYQTSVTNVYRRVLTAQNTVTLQSIICLANVYQQIKRIPDASNLFHEAALTSQKLLTSRHIVTMQMVAVFLELTSERVTESKTDIMIQREEMLLVQVECFKIHYGTTSEKVVSVMKQLLEHYQMVKETAKAQAIMVTIQSITSTEYSTSGTSGSLRVQLMGPGAKDRREIGYTLNLDIEEDAVIETTESYDVEALIELAQRYFNEGKISLAERTYVEFWQRVMRDSRSYSSATWDEQKMKVVIAYSQFLQSQKREYEASSILSSFWQDYEQTSMALSESSVSHLHTIAKVMKTVGLSAMALTIFKRCSEYYQSTRSTETSTYQEIQQSIQTTTKEVMQSATSSTSVVSELTLEEMIMECSTTTTTLDQNFYRSTNTLVDLYMSQRRWQNAARVIKKVLHSVWLGFFAPTPQDVLPPQDQLETSLTLAERLAQCYHSRHRLEKEQDVRLRIYYALRLARNVDDKLRQHSVTELLRLLERTSQTETIITVHQDLLYDYTKHYGAEHSMVIKTLWTLAELTRPRAIFLDYYQQIIQALNKDGQKCHPDALEPLNIVATELWNQGRYPESLNYCKILSIAFRDQPNLSTKFQDQKFVQEIFTRYTHCLRAVRTEFSTLRQVTIEYQSKCKAVFGATASITIQLTLSLAQLCQESKQYELEAIKWYEELLTTKSEEIDRQDISTTLEGLYEEQSSIITERSESVSSTQVEQAAKVMRKRITSLRETYGWAHEESLAKMQEIVSFHAKRNKGELVVHELHDASVQILSSETSATRLSTAATSIASSYIAHKQTEKALGLSEEIYRQIIMRDASNTKTANFDLTSKGRQSLVFLAQFEHHLHSQSAAVTEILASLTTQFVYFEEFRQILQSKSASFYSVTGCAARLYTYLVASGRQSTASRVVVDFTNYFLANEGKHIGFKASSQVNVFILMILHYFSTHQSQDFVRSIGIASNTHVISLLKSQKYDEACDLAVASFKYISGQEIYRTPGIAKFVLALSMNVCGRSITPQPNEAIRKGLLDVSATIVKDVLKVLSELKINLAQIGLDHLNSLIGLLGAQKDYHTLATVLTGIWNSREAQRNWDPYVTFSFGRLFIMARYLIGDTTAAVRLAEDIVYNCRRVHGVRHPSTLETSILLSQLYTSVAQRYHAHKDGQELANRYYKKSAALHENILRAFSDPNFDELEGNLDGSRSIDGSTLELDLAESSIPGTVSAGEQVRRHLQLFKLSIQRLGGWPKDYSEYERLNTELFTEYPAELQGVEGVEKWNLKAFGSGKAESNDDQVNEDFKDWQLFNVQTTVGESLEEEL